MTDDTINDAVTMRPGSEGTLLANRYRIVRQLGQGGMGSVWLVEDTQLDNKQFAVKMLPSILVANKRAYRQLKDETLVAMRLVHPNIVQIRAFEANNGNPFLVMDYIDGQTLDDYLAEHTGTTGVPPVAGGLSEADVLRILRPIAAALDYAHDKGVVHRDVKPGNVMIAKDGTPYILDFGIAREIQKTITRMTGKLSSGTLLYMSPEQLHGASPKPAQDIYSFAAMAYECLKGEPPFVRGQIEYQIDNDIPAPLQGGPRSCAAAVMAGLAKKPENRPATCVAVLRESGTPAASTGTANGIGKSAASPNPQQPALSPSSQPNAGGSRSRATAVMAGLAKKPEDRPATCAVVLRGSGAPAASAGTANRSGKSAASPYPQQPAPPPPPQPNGGGSRSHATAVMAGLAKKPENRPATCAAVLRGCGAPAASAGTANRSGKSAASPNPRQPIPPLPSQPNAGGARFRSMIVILAKKINIHVLSYLIVVGIFGIACVGVEFLNKWTNKWTSGAAKAEARKKETINEWEQRVRRGADPADHGHTKVQLWEGGPYWADTNIGAEKPWETGYYFWWGDTVGYKREHDAWVASDGSAKEFEFAGKNAATYGKDIATLRSEGWITADNVLVPAHDAAHVQWQGRWRMPTDKELTDLREECDWAWAEMEGVNGYIVRGRGDYATASIFVPATGFGTGTLLNNVGSGGNYWSSVLDTDDYKAWSLIFYSSNHNTNNYYRRDYGQSVRPVQGFTK